MGGHFIQETHKMVNIISEIEAIYFKEDIKVKNQHFRFLIGMDEEKASCQHYIIQGVQKETTHRIWLKLDYFFVLRFFKK